MRRNPGAVALAGMYIIAVAMTARRTTDSASADAAGTQYRTAGAGSLSGAERQSLHGLSRNASRNHYGRPDQPRFFNLAESTKNGANGLNNPNSDQPNMNLIGGQAWYNQLILVDPSDATRNTVYLGGILSTAKTTNGGANWTLLSNWLAQFGLPYVHADHHAAAIDAAGRILFGTDGGLSVSADGGTTWSSEKNRGLQTFLFYSIAGTPVFPNGVFGGSQDNGTRVREGISTSYNQMIGGDGLGAAWSQTNGLRGDRQRAEQQHAPDPE